jgi:hypothetical protein
MYYYKAMKCAICGKELVFISPKHLKCVHNIGVAEYRQKYGEIMSAEQKASQVKNQRAHHWSTKPIEETQKFRSKLAENGKKVMALINKDGRAYRWTSETAKALWTEEHRQEIKKQLTGLKRSEETKARIRASHWTKKSNNEVDEIIQRIFLKDAQFKNAERGWYFSTKSGHKMFYMSSYERRRLEYLESLLQVKWFSTMHRIHIPYEFQGNQHLYIPDIHVKWKDGSETLEEIKGYVREPEKHKAKIEAGENHCHLHDMQFVLLFEDNLESISCV